MANRYRIEGGSYCIELRVHEIRQLFDLRDPAPFRERDLDPSAVEYVVEAAEETPADAPLKIMVSVAQPRDPGFSDEAIRTSITAHFEHALTVQGMRIRSHMRQGKIAALVGISVLTVCLLLSNAIGPTTGALGVLREGLTIGGWVAIWRPVEHYLYDWWPILDERRLLRRVLGAQVEIRWAVPRTTLNVPIVASS